MNDEEWDTSSQSLTGYTAAYETEYEYQDEELYGFEAQHYDGWQDDNDEDFLTMSFAMLSEGGLDLQSEEACAYAAECLQLEHEAFLVRSKGKGKGFNGFGQQRHFDITGSVSLQERKARLAQLKAKTECRRCGQKGHWSGDAACPKGATRGSSTSPSKKGSSGYRPPSTMASSGKGKAPKPRVVYFSMANHTEEQSGDHQVYMALHGSENMSSIYDGASIPPPTSLQMTGPTASSTASSAATPVAVPTSFLSSMMTSMALNMQLPVATPVDLNLDGTNLLDPKVRNQLDEEIDRLDPYLLTFAPVCSPWGSWSRLAKNEETAINIMAERDAWYPCLCWIRRTIKRRLARGRKVLLENPWGSEIWSTLCLRKLIEEAPADAESGELLEVVRGDQCAFGLRDHWTGDLHMKPTGFMTASGPIKERLQQRCNGDHFHQPLEGSDRTKRASQWPEALCEAMICGALEDLQHRTVHAAFQDASHEEEGYEEYNFGTLDAVVDKMDEGSAVSVVPEKHDEHELVRQEMMEEVDSPVKLAEIEMERKRKWLRAPREVRVALRRLHHMIGHGSNSAMQQLLRTAGASTESCEAARHFACETCRKRQQVQRPPVVRPPNKLVFNHEVSVDCFEVKDSAGNRHTILSMICLGTLFHQAWWVSAGGVPKSSVCAETMLTGWFQPFGAPQVMTCDRGVHNQGRVKDLLRIHGIQLRYAGVEAAFQIGRTERQGGILKEVIKAAVMERQIVGVQAMKMLVMESSMVKNCRLNHHGFNPAQWVLGRLPADATSLTAEEAEGRTLGVQEEVQSGEDAFSQQLMIRQAAKQAYVKVDSSRRVRAALLRKAVPLRGPYSPGDLVCFHRLGRWFGPGRIIGREGRSTLWVIHGGIPIVVAENQIRPATTSEVLTKQILELRPSRKRRREAVQDQGGEAPFQEDLMMNQVHDDDEAQPGYLELPVEPGPQPVLPPPGLGAEQGEEETPVPVPQEMIVEEEQEEIPVPELEPTSPADGESEQPEPEVAPPSGPMTPAYQGATTLAQALLRSVDGLDGINTSTPVPTTLPTTSAGDRERSRSPLREPAAIPVPDHDSGWLAQQKKEMKHFQCFLAKRVFKKKRQAGAGREVSFEKATDEEKESLVATRQKEWNNWKKFEAMWILPPEEQEKYMKDNPNLEVIPSRWVDTDKSEVGEKPEFKSRLVGRGDLEKGNDLRTDSPTSSQLFLNVIISYAASTQRRLRGGDISAAFLQGTWIKRPLALRLPAGGIPDDEVKPGSLIMCNKSVYGTKDAPRGFWKELHDVLLSCGLKEVPLETSAYYLPGEAGRVAGLLGSHVDDLLWSGTPEMDLVMEKVQKKFNFRLTSSEEFKFCGRIIEQSDKGIKVTCPSVLDRVKAIYVEPQRRKARAEPATPAEISQLRSVVGSLSWLSRVCRPDIGFGVNQLQAVQQKAKVDDLLTANRLLSYAMETKDKGIFYAAGAMDFDTCILLSINDASHAASVQDINGNTVVGHRSQSGRILALASEKFLENGEGHIHMLQWNSSVLKRVCRSTLQAETLSLQLGSEDAEHVRQMMFVMKNLAKHLTPSRNYTDAADHMKILWCTDCRSLSDHLVMPGISEVSDKRLAIDLTSLRQELWRGPGSLVGNPTYTDELPLDRTTDCRWISTKTMVADALTKQMRCEQLHHLMDDGFLRVEFFSASSPERILRV